MTESNSRGIQLSFSSSHIDEANMEDPNPAVEPNPMSMRPQVIARSRPPAAGRDSTEVARQVSVWRRSSLSAGGQKFPEWHMAR